MRFSPELMEYAGRGLYVPYDEKTQAGLRIIDARGEVIYEFGYPRSGFAGFEEIPPLLVESLLFIENRHLLDETLPRANPAVDWPRLMGASMAMLVGTLGGEGQIGRASCREGG